MVSIHTGTEEVRGVWCPACGRPRGISRETLTRPLGAADVVVAGVFGVIGAIMTLSGRSTVRLRCAACRCRFPEPAGAWRIAVRVALLASVLGVIAYVWVVGAAGEVPALLAVAGVVLLHVALYLGFSRRVQRRRKEWRRRAAASTAAPAAP